MDGESEISRTEDVEFLDCLEVTDKGEGWELLDVSLRVLVRITAGGCDLIYGQETLAFAPRDPGTGYERLT